MTPPLRYLLDGGEDRVHRDLEGGRDELALEAVIPLTSRIFVSDIIRVRVDNSPCRPPEVGVVIGFVSLEECGPCVFHGLLLEGVDRRVLGEREEVVRDLLEGALGDFLPGEVLGKEGEFLHVIGGEFQDFTRLFQFTLGVTHVADGDGVLRVLKGEIELVLADDPERADGRRDLDLAIEAVPEDDVRSELVPKDVYFREASDDVNHAVHGLASLLVHEFVTHVIHEVEGVLILDDLEFVGNHIVEVSVRAGGHEAVRDFLVEPAVIESVCGFEGNFVVEARSPEYLFHVLAFFDALAEVRPRCHSCH